MRESLVEAKRWFAQSRADIAVVRTLLAAGHYATACFHAQQAAEKALKSVLFSKGERYVWGHSVRDLARRCEAHDQACSALAEEASLLDQYYIPTRYPNGLPSPAIAADVYTSGQARAALAASERILAVVETILQRAQPPAPSS